jgi:hypothetical protein
MKENKNGISIITCSIKPELCNKMLESIKTTIGTDFETIIFDNREKNLGICQVYNYCAQRAKFPYLCFIHEDIIMATPNWGMTMLEFSEKTTNCGVIGFAGGIIAKKNFICWEKGLEGRYRFYDVGRQGHGNYDIASLVYFYNNPNDEDFAKVVTLDGLFLFVKRSVWEENSFDEERFKGFHFYDADFSFGVAQKRQNYVCLVADIYHFSGGSYDKAYYESALIFQEKWKDRLSCSTDKQKISMIDEINSGGYFLYKTYRFFGIKKSIKHFIEINGLFYFFLLCLFIPIKIVCKIAKKIRTRQQ